MGSEDGGNPGDSNTGSSLTDRVAHAILNDPSRRAILTGAVGAVGTATLLGFATRSPEPGRNDSDHSPLELVPSSDITHRATSSGQWTDPAVWTDGAAPDAEARVLIEKGVTITLGATGTARLDALRVDGTLRVDPTVESHLRVATLVSGPDARLQIGTAASPIQPDVTARITFLDQGPIDESRDPARLSRGLLSMGELTIRGSETTGWTRLDTAPEAGATTLTLPAVPTGWAPGDRLVLPGVVPNATQDEERTIESIDGTTVRLDRALDHDHVPPASDLDAYALNLSRNVVLESENPSDVHRRGHVMVMAPGSDIQYTRFEGLGRTDKRRVVTNPPRGQDRVPGNAETNRRARYALHYHKTGIEADEPHSAEGVVVEDSPGWGVVNHHAYADVTDSITYDVLGSGFVAEGGNERGSFKRNFALRSQGSGDRIDMRNFIPTDHLKPSQDLEGRVDDLGHAGHGFWLQSPLVEVVDNVAAGHRHYGFVYWTRPLLDGSLAEGTEVADRAGTHPNLPWEYVDGQAPLKEAIRQGRHTDYAIEGKVSTAYVRLRRFEDNEVFASAGGLDVSRHQFKWIHERYDAFSRIESFTAYNLGPHVDSDGTEHGVTKRGAKKGGNQAVKCRYASNIRIRNARLLGRNGTGTAVSPHDYLWTTVVDDSTIAGWNVGVAAGEHALTYVRENTFDNAVDTEWVIGNTGPLVLEDNDFGDDGTALRHELSYEDVKAGELFGKRPFAGAVLDGRSAYFTEQRPEYVPIESKEGLVQVTTGSGYERMATVIDHDDPEAVIGLTNRELMDRFGVAVGGTILPDEAEPDPTVGGGLLAPTTSTPPVTAWLNPIAGTLGDGFEVVSEPTAAGDRALRVTDGTGDGPPADPAAVASMEFEIAAGRYGVYGRIWPTSWNGDDLWLRIDGGDWQRWHKVKPPVGFGWYAAKTDTTDDRSHEFPLTEGRHTIEFGCETDGVLIDKMLVAGDGTVVGGYGGPWDTR